MRRDVERLASDRFDLLVLGGGILGACVARDASRRGLETALVERDDFAGGASGNNLKIIHGGLRDLGRLDFGRARRMTRVRAGWLRRAPHLVHPLSVLVPGTPGLGPGPGARRMGAWAGRLLLRGRNRGVPEGRRLASPRLVEARRTREMTPIGAPDDGSPGLLFQDGLMYSAERIVVELIRDAADHGCAVANYSPAEGPLETLPDGGISVGARDRISDTRFSIRATTLVNATGGDSARVSSEVLGLPRDGPGRTALGLNLVVADMGLDAAVALPTSAGRTGPPRASGVRHLFLVPWRGRTLVGTAYRELAASGEPASGAGPKGSLPESKVERLSRELIDDVDEALRGKGPRGEDVRHVHTGLLPLDAEGGLAARPRWFAAPDDGPNVVTVVTDRYTTAPEVARRSVDWVFRRLGHRRPPPGEDAPLPGARGWHRDLADEAAREAPPALDRDVVDHLCRVHGTRWREILDYRDRDDGWHRRVVPEAPVIVAQLLLGADREMAMTPADLLGRRTELEERDLLTDRAVVRAERALEAVGRSRGGARP